MQAFFDKLRRCNDDELTDFCRQTLLHGLPSIFRNREHDYYNFRKKISNHFKIHFHEVIIVGSAKLGFSPHKNKIFDLDSDIDVAIVSGDLFEHILDYALDYQMQLRASRKSITVIELKQYHQFLEYIAMGWVRPDKLPLSFAVGTLKKDWFDFFESLSYDRSEVGNYKVSAGVFKSYRHLEVYTVEMLSRLKSSKNLDEKRGKSN